MYTNLNYVEKKEVLNKLNNDSSHFANSNDICTPMDCVEEMVNMIPEEFWNRDAINILDPCAGNGNFPAYILEKVKNDFILQINEISEKRLNNVRSLFVESNSIKITEKDFLLFEDKKEYDLVIANPPYALFNNGKRTAKNHSVFKDFIKKGLNVLKEDGYLVFIVPDSWMSLSDRNDTPSILSQYQFIYLNIHGAKKYFPKVGSSFTWFVLKKVENKNEFLVDNFYKISERSIVSLDKGISNIPLFYNKIVKSILNKTLNSTCEKFKVETSSNLHKYTKKSLLSVNKDEIFRYEVVHTPKQRVFSKVPHKFQLGWKVFISLTSYYSTFIEKDSGMTQSIAFIRTKNEEESLKIKNILDKPLFKFINDIHRYGNFKNVRILQKFPYEENFSLTEEEVKFIDNFLALTRN